jgi:hypothetical protein
VFEVTVKEQVLQFEHSLLSLSKWEARTKKAFMATPTKTNETMLDYYADMLLTPGVRREVIYTLPPQVLSDLNDYINDPQTAAKPPGEPEKGSVGIITSDLIYSWLVLSKIPFHPTETWHINRVLMLVNPVQHAMKPPKKRSVGERLSDWTRINEENKKRFNSNG